MGDMCRLRRFVAGNCRVRLTETLRAYERLNERDRELFFCDVRQLDWDDFFLTYWRGVRLNVLKERLDEPLGRRCCGCPCKCIGCIGLAVLAVLACFFFLF